MPNTTVILLVYGLNEGIDSDGCGMRPRAEAMAAVLNADVVAVTWNGAGVDYPVERALDRLSGYTRIIVMGHSFGVSRLVWLMKRFLGRVFFFVAFDGAPNTLLGQDYKWKDADVDEEARWEVPSCVEHWLSFTQRNDVFIVKETGIGICGVPFRSDARGTNVDLNQFGPRKINLGLTHAGDRGLCMYQPLYDQALVEMLRLINEEINAEWAASLVGGARGAEAESGGS